MTEHAEGKDIAVPPDNADMEQASDEPGQQWSLLSEEEAIEDEPENEGDEAEPSKSVNVDKCKAKLEHLQKELAMLDTDGENIVKTQVETLKARVNRVTAKKERHGAMMQKLEHLQKELAML